MTRIKRLITLPFLILIFLSGFSDLVNPLPPKLTAFEIGFEKETLKEASGRVFVQEQWLFRFGGSATNEVSVGGVTIPGGSKLANPVFSLAGSPFIALDTNVSPGDRQLIRDRLLTQGLFTPGVDSIFYFQTPNAISYTPLDTVRIHFEFEEGYPVAGVMHAAFTTASDLANGAPLTVFDTLIDRSSLNSERYFNEVFDEVGITQDVVYGVNITILTGTPLPDTLRMDIYEPLNDSSSGRPLVLLAHPGLFLPSQLNGYPTGAKEDSAVVEMCKQFARRGYVSAAISYRLGWNPASSNQNVRTTTYINAIYRGIQDINTANRFFRQNAAIGGNTYGIDTARIVLGGMGEGALVALGAATLDDMSEVHLPSLFDSTNNRYFIDTAMSGNFAGTQDRPLSMANHTGYSSSVAAVFAMGGALLDLSWVDANSPPMIGHHCPLDGFIPYDSGAFIVPGFPDFVVDLFGTKSVLERSFQIGNQAVFSESVLLDRYSHVSYPKNDSIEGFYPFFRPLIENAPWEWWDSLAPPIPFNSNPDMSKEKALRYIDTVMFYIARRLPCALNLPNCDQIDSVPVLASREEASSPPQFFQVYPNPNPGGLLHLETSAPIKTLSLYDASGRWIRRKDPRIGRIGDRSPDFDLRQLPAGLYFLTVEFKNGATLSQRVLVDR